MLEHAGTVGDLLNFNLTG